MPNYNKMADKAIKLAGGRIVGGKALEPKPGLMQKYLNEKADKKFVQGRAKRLKNFKFGTGVGS